MFRYYTVKSPTAADKALTASFIEGSDLSGETYMLAKVPETDPDPVWEGTGVELDVEDVPAARQSAIYQASAGDAYREKCRAFGNGLVSVFVADSTAALPAGVLAGLLEYLLPALVAAQGGYITTLRYILANRADFPPAYTAPVRDALVAECDAFLAKFPGRAGTQ